MELLARLSLPMACHWKWPKVNPLRPLQTFGKVIELYEKALSTAYLTAAFMSADRDKEYLPEELEGRDPRW